MTVHQRFHIASSPQEPNSCPSLPQWTFPRSKVGTHQSVRREFCPSSINRHPPFPLPPEKSLFRLPLPHALPHRTAALRLTGQSPLYDSYYTITSEALQDSEYIFFGKLMAWSWQILLSNKYSLNNLRFKFFGENDDIEERDRKA